MCPALSLFDSWRKNGSLFAKSGQEGKCYFKTSWNTKQKLMLLERKTLDELANEVQELDLGY